MFKKSIVLVPVAFALISVSVVAEEPMKLESHFVGDKEQPAVSYFMPWQGPSSSTEQLYQNNEEKYEMSIDAVDRDEMLRSIQIYEEMNLENR